MSECAVGLEIGEAGRPNTGAKYGHQPSRNQARKDAGLRDGNINAINRYNCIPGTTVWFYSPYLAMQALLWFVLGQSLHVNAL